MVVDWIGKVQKEMVVLFVGNKRYKNKKYENKKNMFEQ